jgi:hypothetical protein
MRMKNNEVSKWQLIFPPYKVDKSSRGGQGFNFPLLGSILNISIDTPLIAAG